jgi:hypothetical protein
MKRARLLIWAVVAALVFSACSCSTEASAIQEILGTSTEAPVFLACKAVSSTEIAFEFSLPVKVLSITLDPEGELDSVTDGQTVTISFSTPLKVGEQVTADILVEDASRNTLNVLAPFRARNDRLPRMLVNEVRTEYSKTTNSKGVSSYKVEFVELKTLDAGNLGALRLFIAGNSVEKPTFEFPPAEVSTGEYIVVHLRSCEDGLVNEVEDDLTLSQGTEAAADARDFWVAGTDKLLHKTDAIYLLDQDDKVLDAVMLSEGADVWAKKTGFIIPAADLLGGQGAWLKTGGSGLPTHADAVASGTTANTRTICRDEDIPDSNTAADWYITAASNATPGKPNSAVRYVAK